MEPTWRDWAGVAVIVPVSGVFAVWLARKIGRWITASLERSFAAVVVDVMAPDMAHLGTKLAASIDELRSSNTFDHAQTVQRLGGLEARQTDVESRLATVESRLNIRPPTARTRATDPED